MTSHLDSGGNAEERTISLYVRNLDCENDAARLKRALEGAEVRDLTIYPKSARLTATISNHEGSERTLRSLLAASGFPVRDQDSGAGPPAPWRNPKVVTSALSGLLLAAGWGLSRAGAGDPVVWALYLCSLASGAYYFGREALDELLHEKAVGIELLMLVAAVAATALGAPSEGAMLAFLYSMSEAAEGYTEAKTRSAVRALMDLTPKVASVRRDGVEIEVPVSELVVGDTFIVKPGGSIPTDGDIVVGRSSLNQAPVTGESVPVEKTTGDKVFAGSINGEGSLEVLATTAFA
ncbi:MAG: cation-transporting P-type ATPase, partial [Gemmatimonadota bacterium]